ncbi:putative transposase IS891/IS1136/IS1341 family [Thermotoga petrophila RKU-10]|uniref:Putative transposase IS891/IS1136/IS1341 family n=1 Tax=Thermotoga petrophila (strain ATCC BAA-489 / DSM 13996 / JCM 10882 / RKU-10) TaxID=590168 RepID=D2C8D4_THEP2|nr:putative transposase IS891/IS1136/IS1341 family [Thermotoga petrophila RKU-10]MBZ4661667.1 putative transposase family [Thermotoga sp.]
MLRICKFRIYPTKKQEEKLAKHFGYTRFVFKLLHHLQSNEASYLLQRTGICFSETQKDKQIFMAQRSELSSASSVDKRFRLCVQKLLQKASQISEVQKEKVVKRLSKCGSQSKGKFLGKSWPSIKGLSCGTKLDEFAELVVQRPSRGYHYFVGDHRTQRVQGDQHRIQRQHQYSR